MATTYVCPACDVQPCGVKAMPYSEPKKLPSTVTVVGITAPPALSVTCTTALVKSTLSLCTDQPLVSRLRRVKRARGTGPLGGKAVQALVLVPWPPMTLRQE